MRTDFEEEDDDDDEDEVGSFPNSCLEHDTNIQFTFKTKLLGKLHKFDTKSWLR